MNAAVELATDHDLPERARAFTLAALASAYPDAAARDAILAVAAAGAAPELLGPWISMASGDFEGVQSRYLSRFDVGKGRVPLYETEYGRMRGLAKGQDLADIRGFYSAFGLEQEDDGEVADHIAMELEFYALLLWKEHLLSDDREGREIVSDARKKFLAAHLGAFAPAVAMQDAVQQCDVYGPLFRWVGALVESESAREGVRVAPLDAFAAAAENDEGPQCGESVLVPGPSRRVRTEGTAPEG